MKCVEVIMSPLLCTTIIIALVVWAPVQADQTKFDPFSIIWNSDVSQCIAQGVPFNFDKFAITANTGGHFYGSNITLFYTMGRWPFYANGKPINGGIPQLCNLTAHYQKVVTDISTLMKDVNYSGLAVIDFEAWRPAWDQNFDALQIYQSKSVELVKSRYPSWNQTDLVAAAKDEFESAARSILEGTLTLAKTMRPQAVWTYYGLPHCFDYKKLCNNSTQAENDRSQWLYQGMLSVAPSIYLHAGSNSPMDAVYGLVRESLRLAERRWDHQVPAIPYASYHYYLEPTNYLDKEGLVASIGQPSDMGCGGVVLWGLEASVDTKAKCLSLSKYVQEVLGPYALTIVTEKRRCSRELCSGRGRCQGRGIYPPQRNIYPSQRDIYPPQRGIYPPQRDIYPPQRDIYPPQRELGAGWDTLYTCLCYPGWTGTDCTTPSTS